MYSYVSIEKEALGTGSWKLEGSLGSGAWSSLRITARMKRYVLTENYEFKCVYNRGRSAVLPVICVYMLRRKKGSGVRIGITAGKKVGNAVRRNRARRVIRAAWRELEDKPSGDYDIVFVARARTAAVKSGVVGRQMAQCFRKLRIEN